MTSDSTMTQQPEYVFAYGTTEQERLLAQGALADPLSRRLLRAAGLAPGMRVLDLGSGAGNVAMLAAELVGPDGRVVGIDRDPDAVDRAQQYVDRAGRANIEFRQGNVQTLDGVEAGFDAVTGRWILAYLADPVDALRQAAARVRPGGVVCMHEPDIGNVWASPETPLWRQVRAWLVEAVTEVGAHEHMGLELFGAFRAAGLPDPELMLEGFAGGGAQAPAWFWANVVSAMMPLIERLGIATSGEVDEATLAERLLAEINAEDGIVLGPPMIGAYSTAPPIHAGAS